MNSKLNFQTLLLYNKGWKFLSFNINKNITFKNFMYLSGKNFGNNIKEDNQNEENHLISANKKEFTLEEKQNLKIKNYEYFSSKNYITKSNEDISLNLSKTDKNDTLISNISERIFNSIMYDDRAIDTNKKMSLEENKQIINFSSSELNDPNNKSQFILNIDRTINFKENKVFQDLVLKNKIDFEDKNLKLTSIKMESQSFIDTEDLVSNDKKGQPIDILQVDLGDIKSIPKLNKNLMLSEDELNLLIKNKNYDYEMSLIGRKITEEELKDKKNMNLEDYVLLNEKNEKNSQCMKISEVHHYISPLIFHDEETKEHSNVNVRDSIISYLLRNPLMIFGFMLFGFYVYPLLWKKEFFMNLSEDYNNKKILDNHDKIYDYINYRRGLYASVRSNFS